MELPGRWNIGIFRYPANHTREMSCMSYCLYLRKSRADAEAEARGEGETLARHEHALLELGKKMKLDITYIYREIVSGETIAARPVMQQLLTDVEKGAWEGVLVMEVERLARGDTIDQGIVAQAFQLSETKIITPAKIYDPDNEYDEEYFEFGLFMSRREYKTINRRLQRGRIASVKEGKYVGSKPPYGYLRKKLEHDKGFTLVPNPVQSPVVKAIFGWYAYGEQSGGTVHRMGISKIARRLNDLKIPPYEGDAWGNASIRQMLRNPVYIGKIRWNSRPLRKAMADGRIVKKRPRTKSADWVVADGLQEPLIDSATWGTVQERLKEHGPHPPPEGREMKNPLSGLVVCGICGRKMIRRPCADRNGSDILMCPAASCNNISSRLECVETCILKSLHEWLGNYKLSFHGESHAASVTASLQQSLRLAQGELFNLQRQKNSIYGLLERGIYTAEVFRKRIQAVSQKIEDVQGNILELEDKVRQDGLKNQNPMIPKVGQVLEQYTEAKSPAEKNALLKSVVEKVIYTKKTNGRWHGQPDDFELILYPKLPKSSTDH